MNPKNYLEIDFEKHIEEQLHIAGYSPSSPADYNKTLFLIPNVLIKFIKDTQLNSFSKLANQYGIDTEEKLTKRVSAEIESRGVIDVLRNGVKDRGCYFSLVYFQPKSGLNPDHKEFFKKNRFSTVRQLKYSLKNENSIDMGIFINGIPIIMMELKNSLTGQDHTNAIKQWKYDRDPKEPLFKFKRNLVYFAVGNELIYMTTRLTGSNTRFLPFNKGIENPVNPKGHKTNYLWDEILQPKTVLDLIGNFVHIRTESEKEYDTKKGKVIERNKELLVFPRYHQLNVINRLKQSIIEDGVGHNYLIQHTTGSGKSLSIGWLSHLLSSLYQNQDDTNRMFDSVIVVTDRRVLDKQIRNTIKQLEQTKGVVNPADLNAKQLKEFIEAGKAIIITTIQKFPVISESISKIQNRKFAIVIDEVHSSQSGETSKHLKKSLSKSILDEYQEGEDEDDLTDVDKLILEEISQRGKLPHISYFGFSGTPKNKTLEIFGSKTEEGNFLPYDLYSMKQSIAEGFTLDVLQNYTTYKRYFKLNKILREDKELPKSRVKTLLVKWVDLHPHTIKEKTKIILEHFTQHTSNKIIGKSRGMLVTRSRLHCVRYKLEFDKQMKDMGLPYRALVGFSGKVYDKGTHQEYTESSMNGFSEKYTGENFKDPKYRILIVNNKFQTGFDEPMLHTMYVDKKFGGLQCVQTLSRLNRTMSGKTDTFVLDFVNDPSVVEESFQPYYQGTILTEETDPNLLYTIEQEIKKFNLFYDDIVNTYVQIFYDYINPLEESQGILDAIVEDWKQLSEEEQEEFRRHIQSFIRLYGYILQVVTFKDLGLEKLHIFLISLNKKLPKREKEKLSDILSSVDLEYFKIEKKYSRSIEIDEEDGELSGINVAEEGGPIEEETELLSMIIKTLNDSFDGDFTDEDKVNLEKIEKRIHQDDYLKNIMVGNNTESNKKHAFNLAFENFLIELVGENLDFYNKLKEPDKNRFVKDRMYEKYSRSFNL